jgi:hypothetical protein
VCPSLCLPATPKLKANHRARKRRSARRHVFTALAADHSESASGALPRRTAVTLRDALLGRPGGCASALVRDGKPMPPRGCAPVPAVSGGTCVSGRAACWDRADAPLANRPFTCGNCRQVHDHPDLRGHQPDPARRDGAAAAEGLIRAVDLRFLWSPRGRRVTGLTSPAALAHAGIVPLVLLISGRFWSAC